MSELRSDARLLAQAKGSMDEDAARWRFRRNTILRERKLLLLGIAAELAERRNRWAKNERERERLKVPEPIVPEVRYDRSEVNGWHLNFMTLLSSSEDSWMFFHTDDPAACQCDDCKRTMLEVEARRLEGTQTLGIGRGYRDWQRRHPDRVVPRDPQAIVDRWAAVAAQPDAAEQGRLL